MIVVRSNQTIAWNKTTMKKAKPYYSQKVLLI